MNGSLVRTVSVLAIVAAAGTALFWLQDDASAPQPAPVVPVGTTDNSPKGEALRSSSAPVSPPTTRAVVESEMADLPDLPAELVVHGRVVDQAGNPITAAMVHAQQRERFDIGAMFRGRPPEGSREEMMERFRLRSLADPVTTRNDGTFTLEGASFSEAELTVTANHTTYAPTVVERTWRVADGALTLGDIVLPVGTFVRGVVVDESGQAIRGATVSYQGEGGRRFGRENPVSELVEAIVTDATGQFEIGPIPYGSFNLEADAERFLQTRGDRLEAREDGNLAEQTLTLVRAATLAGIVTDASGNPIAGAEVSARRVRESEEDRGGRGERRGRGNRGRRGRAPWEDDDRVETDAEGKFELAEVEPGMLAVEVEHEDFLDTTLEPVDPQQSPWVEIAMDPALVARGVLLDANTGSPIEEFGIVARRTRGQGDERWRRMIEGGEGSEDDGSRAARDQWRRDRLGGSGEVPQRTPVPEHHAGGRFELKGLEPGNYVFDINAPGYVRIAAGAIELDSNNASALQFEVERGTRLIGRVVRRDGSPVADAEVSLRLPPAPGETSDEPDRGGFGRGGFGRGRGPWGERPVSEATTDDEGYFELTPVRHGEFDLRATAEGLIEYRSSVVVNASQADQDVKVVMTAGGTVIGTVIGYEQGRDDRVMLVHTEGERHFAEVDPSTGGYEIRGLAAGGYQVTLMEGDSRDGRRRMFASFLNADESQPDVVVTEGSVSRFDVGNEDLDLGRVEGLVHRNGLPAEGAEVQLGKVGDDGDESPEQRIRRAFERRMLSGRVGSDGRFAIQDVTPGTYELVVTMGDQGGRGRGGRGGGSTLHRQTVQVVAAAVTPVQVGLEVGEVEFRVQTAATVEASRIRVSLVLAEEAADQEPREWRRLDSYSRLTVRDGVAKQGVAPGHYRYSIEGQGIESQSGEIHVSLGQTASISAFLEPSSDK